MANSAVPNDRKLPAKNSRNLCGERSVTAIALRTIDLNEAIATRLRRFGAKVLARHAGTSPRTAENWLQREASPALKHAAAMMQDDELCAELLRAVGRADIADLVEIKAKLKAAKVALEGVDL